MKKERVVSATSFRRRAQERDENYAERMDEAALEIHLEMEIRRLRKAQKLTQADLAEKMHTKQASVSRLEKDVANVKLHTLIKLAMALGKRLEIRFL